MSVIVRSKSGELEITVRFIALVVIQCWPSALTMLCVCASVCVVLFCFQVIYCSSVREQTLRFFRVSDKKRSKGYACTWSVMQQ